MPENNGKNTIDPTYNVRELIDASIKRLDDIRQIEVDRITDKIDASDVKYQVQFNAAKEAVNKAETAAEKRFESVNEFRATLSDQQRNLMPRIEVEILMKGMDNRIDAINTVLAKTEGKGMGMGQAVAWIIGAIGIVSGIFAIIDRFSN